MKVEINTYDKSVSVVSNETVKNVADVDQWIKALQLARAWLMKQRAAK